MNTAARVLVGILVLGLVLAIGLPIVFDGDDAPDPALQPAKQAAPDTAPAEFAYLDSARVLAYLGQIEGGLAATQERTLSRKTATKASLTAKEIASAEVSSEQLRGSSETVTLTEADRFYTLLRILNKKQDAHAFSPLVTVDSLLTRNNTVETVRQALSRMDEGDFVRIKNAHLFIPPYAAILPRAKFASYYLGGDLKEPRVALYAPVSRPFQRAVRKYRMSLRKDARIPLVVPTLDAQRKAQQVVTFLLPARYGSLSQEASLLGNELTIVGKVVYKDPRLPGEVPAEDPSKGSYLDRETLTRFAPALERADGMVLERLELTRSRIVEQVRKSLTINAPVAVVIPVAVYA
jgi:hypothetical protein